MSVRLNLARVCSRCGCSSRAPAWCGVDSADGTPYRGNVISAIRPSLRSSLALLFAAVTALAWAGPAARAQTPAAGQVFRTSLHDFRLEVVTELIHPHSMAFTPEGDMLITERPGRLRIVRQGKLLPTPVAGIPDVLVLGNGATAQDGREQAGLRDVVLHPSFATNRLLYLSYVKPGPNGYGNLAVARGRFENDRLSNVQDIFQAAAPGNGTNRSSMWGGRIAFDQAGYLFITLGDRQWPAVADLNRHPAQDLLTHNGKTVRLHDDGRVPKDNPFVGKPGWRAEKYTLGNRNMQGAALHPQRSEVPTP